MIVEPRVGPSGMCSRVQESIALGGGPNDSRGAGGPIHIRRPNDPDAGTDFLIAGDARAAAVYLFFGKATRPGLSGSNSRS